MLLLRILSIIEAELSHITPEMVEAEANEMVEMHQRDTVVGTVKSDLTRKLFTLWQIYCKRIKVEEALGAVQYDPAKKAEHQRNEIRYVSYGGAVKELFWIEAKEELDCYSTDAIGIYKGWVIATGCDCPACKLEKGEAIEGIGVALPRELGALLGGAVRMAVERRRRRRRQEEEEKKEPEKGAGVN